MKYPEHRMSLEAAMPLSDSVLSWLGNQLEVRGIDSVIYTRYIISLLQQDVADIDIADREELWDIKAESKKSKDKKEGKKKPVSEEERRKIAAVECLLSVSDEANDIESLVEELYIKLKETKSNQDYFTPLTIHTKEKSKYLSEVQDPPKRTETQDPAERYYAAFPALPGDGSPAQVSPSSDDNIWRKTRKSGSLAGEASESKGNSPRNVKDGEDKLAANELQVERENVDDSEAQSCSPAANDKRKKPSKSDGNRKLTPSGNSKKKVTAPKAKEVGGKSKAVRFLSWPQSEKGKEEPVAFQKTHRKNVTREETEEKKYCHMVEQMLKEMLMTGNKPIQTYTDFSVFNYYPQEFEDGGLTSWFREDSQSPEFAENDDWYTQPLEHIFYTPVSQTKRLYKRHSYPPSSVTLEHQIELNAIVTEQLLCLKRTSQEYLPEDVFEAEEKDASNNEDTVSPGITHNSCGKTDGVEKLQEGTQKQEFAYTIDTPESDGKADVGRFEDNGEDTESYPSWFTYNHPYASNIPFAFDQSELTTDNEKVGADSDVFATMFKLPNPLPDLDYLVPASDTSSTVSSVEKGYFSDVTETSFLFDTSQHGSPFPDVLLLMDYGEEQDDQDGSSFANGLKGSRLESLFETSKHESTRNAEADSEYVPVDAEKRPEFPDIADPFLCTEKNFVPCGTRNMLPNGARLEESGVEAAHVEMLDSSGPQLDELKLHEQMSTLQLSESTSDEDEMDESACFPSDLFSSFSSVGEGSLVQPEESDHDIFDFGSDQWKTNYSPSVFLHLSPFGTSGSCWQNKVLLHNYGERLSFESLFWPSTMNERKSEVWKTVLDGPTTEITIGAQFRGELWQLWNVNGQKKIPDLWQEEGKSNIWNSCLNLSCYVSNNFEHESSLSSKDEVTFAEIINDDVLGLQFLEEINGLGYMGHRCERSVSESDLQHMSSTLFYEFTKPNLDISYELIPSENSAFQGVIPKQLHHVQSAPNLRCLMSMLQEEDDLQLTSGAVSNIESPAEHLYFSSKTHFRPIQTPVATPDEDEFNPQDLFGGMKDTTGTPYQQFVNPGEEESKFRPKFKLQKDYDKYIQTGRSLDEADDYEKLVPVIVEAAKDCQTEFIEEVVVGCVLDDRPEANRDWYRQKEQKGSFMHERDDVSLCPKEMMKEKLVSGLCESLNDLHMTKNSSMTGDQDETNQPEEQSGLDEESRWDGQKIKEMNLSEKLKDYHDIWSSGYEMDLHPFSVESECVFLPCTVDERRLCKSQVTTNEDNQDLDPETPHQSDELYFYYLDSYPEVDSYILSTCPEDCPEQQGYDVSGLVPIPHQAVYSSDLEKQWLDSKAGKATQKLHRLKIKKDSSKNKPCSFFLEGNCKRSDCKFSHDLSSITCRFWEEGLCFKGQLCPFFHGYQSYNEVDSDHNEKTGRKFEFKKDDFPELDTRCKYKQRHEKDLHSKKISRKRQAHKEFLKKTLSGRKKIKHTPKQHVKTDESSSF